jgi:DNA modification methylase
MNTFISTTIELWPIEKLIPYNRNARTHSDEQIEQIARSIQEFGFTNPILVDTRAGILAGHARLRGALRAGLLQVPVIVLDHLTETQKRAYILADNKLALNAGWDDELLAQELAALEQDGFDRSLTGFSDAELAELLAQDPPDQDENAVPDKCAIAVSRPGDLWLLGRHRLLCGDATNPDCIATLMDGATANMVFTDPPYNVNYEGANGQRIANDNLGGGFEEFLTQACTNLLRATSGAVYICMSSSELHTLYCAFTKAGGHWSTFIIWAKDRFTLGRSDYQRQFEPILYGWKQGGRHYWCGDRDQGDVWFVDKPVANELHPTMKPVELIERAIRNSSQGGELVLDPFGGSGSTLIACETTGRKARLLEIDPLYVDVAVRRWQRFTGKLAIRAEDKLTFDEIAAAGAA